MSNQIVSCKLCSVQYDEKSKDTHLMGKKHKMALQRKTSMTRKEECGIYVTGFDHNNVDTEQFINMFAKFGQINLHYFAKSYAIIEFKDSFAAKTVIKSKLHYQGHYLRIKQREIKWNEKSKDTKQTILNGVQKILLKISGFENQLQALISEITYPEQSIKKKSIILCNDLQQALSERFPGCSVYPFGSTVTGLSFKNSDVDIFVSIPEQVKEKLLNENSTENLSVMFVRLSKRLLIKSHLFTKVTPIHKAKTPIVKCTHKRTGLNCDFNCKSSFGNANSNLIKLFLSVDVRLMHTMIILKYWGKVHELTGPGKMSNYGLTLLFIFYLQQGDNSVFPSVSSLQMPGYEFIEDGWNGGFNSDRNLFPVINKNLSIPALLFAFFKYYSSFEYAFNVVCPFLGRTVPKAYFQYINKLPSELNHYKTQISSECALDVDKVFCVQDPFVLNHNIMKNINDKDLQHFQNTCNFSLDIVTNDDSMLLYNLFYSAPLSYSGVMTNYLNSFAICFNPLFIKTVNVDSDGENSNIILKTMWFDFLDDFFLQVLTKVFLFQFISEEDVLVQKSAKLEGKTDVHDSDDQVVMYHCKGYCNTWESRKRIAKVVKHTYQNASSLEREIKITEYIYDKYKEEQQAASAIIDFQFIFIKNFDLTKAVLQLKNLNSKKSYFKTMSYCLTTWLPVWFDKYLNEFYTKKILKDLNLPSNSNPVQNLKRVYINENIRENETPKQYKNEENSKIDLQINSTVVQNPVKNLKEVSIKEKVETMVRPETPEKDKSEEQKNDLDEYENPFLRSIKNAYPLQPNIRTYLESILEKI